MRFSSGSARSNSCCPRQSQRPVCSPDSNDGPRTEMPGAVLRPGPQTSPPRVWVPGKLSHEPSFTLGMCLSTFVCIVSRPPISFHAMAFDQSDGCDARECPLYSFSARTRKKGSSERKNSCPRFCRCLAVAEPAGRNPRSQTTFCRWLLCIRRGSNRAVVSAPLFLVRSRLSPIAGGQRNTPQVSCG